MARSVVATIRGVVNVFWDTDRSGVFTMLALLLLPTGESESRPLPASPPAECREQKATPAARPDNSVSCKRG